MFDTTWVGDLDGGAAAAAVAANHRAKLEAECTELVLAAHWADLHAGADLPGETTTGGERRVHRGGAGAPGMAEFAPAEFGAEAGIGFIAAENLVRDAVNLRHRHPRLWARIQAAGVRAWQARKIAQRCADLDLDAAQAGWVDEQTTAYLGCLPWARFERLLEARIIEADPAAAQARAEAEAARRFVATGRSETYGLRTIIARVESGDAIWFTAMLDRIAAILATQGDDSEIGIRRSKAVGILADPAHALMLLHAHQPPEPDTEPDTEPDADASPSPDGPVGERDLAPGANDADDPARVPCPTCAGAGDVAGAAAVSAQAGFRAALAAGLARLDPQQIRPQAVVYLHLSHAAVHTPATGASNQITPGAVARCEDEGPLTLAQARSFLGHAHVTMRPVLDLDAQTPVDAYEVPHPMREAMHLRSPAAVFPYSTSLSRHHDLDHTRPYRDPTAGGPPGQTHPGNLGKLDRRTHRIKTHGSWHHTQPTPGVHLWATPHGHWFRVDHTGTHDLAHTPETTRPPPESSPLEARLEELITSCSS